MKKSFYTHVLLLVIPLLIVLLWFSKGTILAGGEEGVLFYNPFRLLDLSNSIWYVILTGEPAVGFLPQLPIAIVFLSSSFFHVSPVIFQSLCFYLLMASGVISMYHLVRHFLSENKNREVISFYSAIFYLLNPYTFMQIWERGLTPQYFLFAALPISLLLFVIGIHKHKYISAVLLTISFLVLSFAFSLITNVVVIWSVLFLYTVFNIYTHCQKEQILYSLKFFLMVFFLWIFISSWWLLPLFTSFGLTTQGIHIDSKANLQSLIGVSQYFPLQTLIRLGQDYFFQSGIYGNIYKNNFLQIISWLMPIMVVVSLINFKRIKDLYFFLLLFLIGICISLGSNFPTGHAFVWLFNHISFLQAFRNPYEKYGLVYVLGYAPLYAYGVIEMSLLLKNLLHIPVSSKVYSLIIFCLISGIYIWPMVNHMSTKGVIIPAYYSEVNNWLQEHEGNQYKSAATPIVGQGLRQQWGNTIYSGFDPINFLLNQSVISSDIGLPYITDMMQHMKKTMFTENILSYFLMLNVKYVLVRNDVIDSQNSNDKYLFKYTFQPTEDTLNKAICLGKKSVMSFQSYVQIVCNLNSNSENLQEISFMKFFIKTDQPARLVINMYDVRGVKTTWDEQNSNRYNTTGGDFNEIILPIKQATQLYDYYQLNHTLSLEIFAYPLPKGKNVTNMNLNKILLDPGRKQKNNTYDFVKSFGKIEIYKPNFSFPAPHLDVLSKVVVTNDFDSLDNSLNQVRNNFRDNVFILRNQNMGKNYQLLSQSSKSILGKRRNITSTRTWIALLPSQTTYLLLSETFNSQWKVVPNISEKQISNTLWNNIQLLYKTPLAENSHFVANGYANFWVIKKNHTTFAVIFLPQIYADIGYQISEYTFIILLSIVIICYIIKKGFIFKSKIK